MPKNLEIEITADGSPTIYIPEMEEHYHSIKGAVTESRHIFRDCGLLHHPKKEVRVLEIGFGTGLNAAISALCPEKVVDYLTLELYPLSEDMMLKAQEGSEHPELRAKIREAEWSVRTQITPNFFITKIQTDFTNPDLPLPQNIDVVYFDAFAPEKQPEMWSDDCFKRVFDAMNSGGILTTYCAKGEIRRRLQATGFAVERLAGPPGGKREILRATKY